MVRVTSQRYYPENDHELLLEKARRRAILREEFLKQSTNPFRHASGEGGTVFDSGIMRFGAMKVNQYEYFRATPKTSAIGFFCLVLPLVVTYQVFKTNREEKERKYRSGEIPYSERLFKFI